MPPKASTNSEDNAGYVYLITGPEPGLVKVGHAKDPAKRLRSAMKDVRTWRIPVPAFAIYAEVWFPDRKKAERVAHTLLAEQRIGRSEWFLVDPAVALNAVNDVHQLSLGD